MDNFKRNAWTYVTRGCDFAVEVELDKSIRTKMHAVQSGAVTMEML